MNSTDAGQHEPERDGDCDPRHRAVRGAVPADRPQHHHGVDERRDEHPQRELDDPVTEEHLQHPRGELGARQLQDHDRDREHQTGEGDHGLDDRRQEAAGPLRRPREHRDTVRHREHVVEGDQADRQPHRRDHTQRGHQPERRPGHVADAGRGDAGHQARDRGEHQVWSRRGNTTSRRSRRMAAATGIATSAPTIPNSTPPRRTATRVAVAGTCTVRFITLGTSR